MLPFHPPPPPPPSSRSDGVGALGSHWRYTMAPPLDYVRRSVQLLCRKQIPPQPLLTYPLNMERFEFGSIEITRWFDLVNIRLQLKNERTHILQSQRVSPSFLAWLNDRHGVVINYDAANVCMDNCTFCMSQLSHLAPEFRALDFLFQCDLKYGYYHLRLQ